MVRPRRPVTGDARGRHVREATTGTPCSCTASRRRRRPLVVAGPATDPGHDGPAAARFAARWSVPTLADPLSGARFAPGIGDPPVGPHPGRLRPFPARPGRGPPLRAGPHHPGGAHPDLRRAGAGAGRMDPGHPYRDRRRCAPEGPPGAGGPLPERVGREGPVPAGRRRGRPPRPAPPASTGRAPGRSSKRPPGRPSRRSLPTRTARVPTRPP